MRAFGVSTSLLLSVAIAWGQAGAPVSLETLQGVDPSTGRSESVSLGAPVLHLVFFATWCPPCVGELEVLAEFEERWRDAGYRLVLVAVQNRQNAERLQRFQQDAPRPGRLLFDADGSLEKRLEVEGVPQHVVFDDVGREIARGDRLVDVRATIEQRLGSKRGGGS